MTNNLATFHSAVWTWLASAKPGTYKVDALVPYINQLAGNSSQAITIQDRSLFIEAVMFWMDSGLHPQCDFNSEYSKMRIYQDGAARRYSNQSTKRNALPASKEETALDS
jgi:hypothetical protein